MAIGSDALIEFYGTTEDVSSTPSSISTVSYSAGATDCPAWTNDDDAPAAAMTLEGTLGATGEAGSFVDLYVQKMNVIDTTDDDTAPSATNDFAHQYLGSFPADDTTTLRYTIEVALPNYKTSSEFVFWLYNGTGQTLSSWTLQITPKTYGPHA